MQKKNICANIHETILKKYFPLYNDSKRLPGESLMLKVI